MTALLYILLILLGYAALTVWVAHLTRAFRLRQTPLTIALLALPPALCAHCDFLPAPAACCLWPFCSSA